MRRVALPVAVALVIAGLVATMAQASYHLMKIREVHDGGGGIPAEYIELQMTAPGQNLVAGHYVQTYDNAGNPQGPPYQFSGPNPANGENQSTILITDGGGGTPTPDYVFPGLTVASPAGSACYIDTLPPADGLPAAGLDCVAWGATAPPTTTSPVGMPALFLDGGLPAGGTLRRTIAPNCPTLLEDVDDTTDSATDFSLVSPDPRNNASPITETPCVGSAPPDTEITKGPKAKTRSKKVTFEFTATTTGSTFQCNLDGAGFQPCTSPFDVKVKKGKHNFQVRATDPAGNVDPAPAQAHWKVKKKKKK